MAASLGVSNCPASRLRISLTVLHSGELMRRGASWSRCVPVFSPQLSIRNDVTVDRGLLLVCQVEILPQTNQIPLGLQDHTRCESFGS